MRSAILRVLSLFFFFPNFRYLLIYFAQIFYGAQYGATMLWYLSYIATCQSENSISIWNLLWLSKRLIIWFEQANICISTFRNILTSKKVKKKTIYVYFFVKRYWDEKGKHLAPFMPKEEKTFGVPIDLNFRTWWLHMQMKNYRLASSHLYTARGKTRSASWDGYASPMILSHRTACCNVDWGRVSLFQGFSLQFAVGSTLE